LERYREQVCTFNDDIQGTAAVSLAGLYSALRLTGDQLKEQRLLFLGAGEAGTGIANLVVSAMMEEGLTEKEARLRCWFVDSKGLVVQSRRDLPSYKRIFAHDHEFLPDLLTAVEALKPTALIGACGRPNMFTQQVLETMAELNERPIIFSLSNPTSQSECTAEEAYRWTGGRAIFASGSPFDPVTINGQYFVPAQGNNAYIFPGIGLGVLVSGARLVTDEMFMTAAKTLAHQVSEADLEQGCIMPPLANIREVSAKLATAVAQVAYRRGLATEPEPADLLSAVRASMYQPEYQPYL
jgi:malate dehydrogenase (oxaloacetate-decarboxylating)(NADP+)